MHLIAMLKLKFAISLCTLILEIKIYIFAVLWNILILALILLSCV